MTTAELGSLANSKFLLSEHEPRSLNLTRLDSKPNLNLSLIKIRKDKSLVLGFTCNSLSNPFLIKEKFQAFV